MLAAFKTEAPSWNWTLRRMFPCLVGLPDVTVLIIDDEVAGPLRCIE